VLFSLLLKIGSIVVLFKEEQHLKNLFVVVRLISTQCCNKETTGSRVVEEEQIFQSSSFDT
jgi:hypothetical protein